MNELNDELETLVDRYTLSVVIEKLVEVCRDKAEHLTSNWNDGVQGREWRMAATALEKVQMRVQV